MTNEEVKEALITGRHVVTDWQTIKNIPGHVSAIIHRKGKGGGIRMSVEIHDPNANSVIIADPAKVRFKEE